MPASETLAEWAKTLAETLVASGATPPAALTDTQRLALAWAIKDRAIAAWSSAPAEVAVAASVLARLLPDQTDSQTSATHTELGAIHGWVSGIADLTRGGMTDALTHLDRAAAQFQSIGQFGRAANAQVPKIMALSVLGRHAEATGCGVAIFAELVRSGELLPAAKVSLNLGNLYCRIGNFSDALQQYEKATRLFETVGDQQWSVMSEIGMGDANASLGNFDTALASYADAKKRASEHALPVLQAMTEESVSLVCLARGAYRDAFAGMERARQGYAELDMPQHLAIAEKQLADAYLEVRLLPEAVSLYDRALSRFESLEMPVEQAWALVQRARARAALARSPEEIADDLQRSRDLFSAQDVSAGRATVLLAKAELAIKQGDAEVAATLAAEAADAYAESSLAPGQAQADVVRAHALLQCADIDGAATLFADTLARAHELQLLSVAVRCQVGLGLVAKARGDTLAAEALFESAIASSEEQRSALPGDDIRGAFLLDQLRPYEEVLRIALDACEDAPSDTSATRVVMQLERFRARVLGERLGGSRPHASVSSLSSPQDGQETALRERLSWLYRSAQKLIDDGDDPQPLIAETRRIEHDLLELARRRRLTGSVSELAGEDRAFEPASLQAALATGQTLVEYGVIDDELFACVVTREHVTVQRRLATWSSVVEAVRSARFQIETMRYGAGTIGSHAELLTRRSQVAMRRVHDLVWAPIRPLLDGQGSAIIVPHDQLGSLQFAALFDGEKYLAERTEIAVVASAKVALYGISHPPCVASRALVVGESSRLAHAAQETERVAALFDHADVLLDSEANAVRLRAACVAADVLHLACHAEFRSDNPMFSALQLADGPFTVQDAEALHLRQGMVVLSACETGVATYSRGDEMIGLVRAFTLAGAARVVASMWPVDDATTVKFMTAFYRSLRDGKRPALALRSAQLELMATHPHPFHWAAFTLYGGH
jgi:tetratricopeptide (TPR) repeat protein